MNASVIIPVWNGLADLPVCLTSLFAQVDQTVEIIAVEVIAVDNASADGSADYISREFPQVKLIRNKTNVGFSAACNIGLRQAKGDILILLNQDTEVQAGWLASLTAVIANNKTIGVAGSKAIFEDSTIQHAGGQIDVQGFGSHIGHQEQDSGQYDQRKDVDYVSGASLAISRQAYGQVGGFDEKFGLAYYEDVDLCYRVRDAGYRVVYEPDSLLIHNEKSISKDGSIESNARVQKNRLRFVFKNWQGKKLRQEFIPAEQEWLINIAPQDPNLVSSVRKAYLRFMVSSAELSTYRKNNHNDDLNILQLAQSFWSNIEMQERMRPLFYTEIQQKTRLDIESVPPQIGVCLDQSIEEIRKRHPLHPQPFQSDVPLIGSLIAGFRQRWNRVAAEWFVMPIVIQQNKITTSIIRAFEQVAKEHESAIRIESGYVSELAQQISQLEETVQNLQAQIAEMQAAQAVDVDSDEP